MASREKNEEAPYPSNRSCKEEEASPLPHYFFAIIFCNYFVQIYFCEFQFCSTASLSAHYQRRANDCIGGVVIILPGDEMVENLTITTTLKGGAAERLFLIQFLSKDSLKLSIAASKRDRSGSVTHFYKIWLTVIYSLD